MSHVSHALKMLKIILFDPMMCKSPDPPLQDELLTRTSQLKTANLRVNEIFERENSSFEP